MGDPVILVCGFGRCGSTMVMTMLQRAGLPVAGSAPDFEDSRALHDPRWVAQQNGRAVKLLDPHRFPPARGSYRAVWLARDPWQQARSMAKMLRSLGGIPISHADLYGFTDSYRRDHPKAMQALAQVGAPVLTLRFEEILADPVAAAEALARFIGRSLNVATMAAVVQPRTPECQPGLDIEARLAADIDAGAG